MSLLRCFHPGPLEPGLIELSSRESHHLIRVRRADPGETTEVLDGCGHRARARFVLFEKGRARLEVFKVETCPPLPELVLAVPLPRASRADWLIEKLSELGAARLVPLQTQRGIDRAGPAGSERERRWRRLAIESAKQSGRPWLLEVDRPRQIEEVLDQGGHETLFAASLDPESPGLLKTVAGRPPRAPTLAVIGPEGGFTAVEERLLERQGAERVRLSPYVLRVETAAVALTACLLQAMVPPITRESSP